MRITKRQLKRIIKEEKAHILEQENQYQMSTPEQRAAPTGPGSVADAVRLLGGIMEDWENTPAMNHSEGDEFRDRAYKVLDILIDASIGGA